MGTTRLKYSIGQEILDAAARYSDRMAYLGGNGQALSYQGLANLICATASLLQRQGVRQGSCVAVHTSDHTAHLMSIAACSLLGAAWTDGLVPLHDGIDRRVTHHVYSGQLPGKKLPGKAIRLVVAELNGEQGQMRAFPGFATDETIARITFSSGTTGTPKAIGISAKDDWARVTYDYPNDGLRGQAPVCLSLFSQASGHGCKTKIRTLLAGGTNVGSVSKALLASKKINQVVGSPSQLSQFIRQFDERKTPFKVLQIQVGGGHPGPRLLRTLRKRAESILVFYGATEIGDIAFYPHAERGDYDGRLIIDRKDLELGFYSSSASSYGAKPDQRLRFRSSSGRAHYFRPGLDEEKFDGDWFLSSDEGWLDASGYLYLKKRESDTANIGGVTVDLTLYDDFIAHFEGIADGYSILITDRFGVEALAYFLAFRPGFSPPEQSKQLALATVREKRLPLPPLLVYASPQIPRTPMGKPDKRHATELAKAMRPLLVTRAQR